MSADGKDPLDTDVKAAKSNAVRVIALSMILIIPASIYLIFFTLGDDNLVSRHGHIAHILGVILAFASALLFMGITFFSARSGHDDQPNYRQLVEDHRADEKLAHDALLGKGAGKRE